ncbi:MAG: sensor histidine kinase [Armatimonadetes bacterium]|nr:sensor histidine kinase [Armatimonadota bacterium]
MPPAFRSGLFGCDRADANRLPPGQHPAIATQAMEERAISLRCAAAREEERRRMAADLHDGPTQQLVNLVLRLDLAEQGLPPEAEETRRELAHLRQYTRDLLQDLRRFMFELRPASLEEFALLPVLRQYLQDYRAQYGIHVDLQLSDGDWNLGRDHEVNLFRIIQEALTNARKHARASRVTVTLCQRQAQVIAEVTDDGRGFDLAAARLRAPLEKRLGLAGMEDRARALGGHLEIHTTEGGTRIRVLVPLEPDGSGAPHG